MFSWEDYLKTWDRWNSRRGDLQHPLEPTAATVNMLTHVDACWVMVLDKALLKYFAKFTGKQLCQNLFSNKVADLWDATLSKKRLSHWCLPVIQTSVFYFMSRVNNVCLFVINYLSQRCHELSKARWHNFVPAFRNLWKGEAEIVQACDSCGMPGVCTSIVLAFIWEWNYLILVDRGNLLEPG